MRRLRKPSRRAPRRRVRIQSAKPLARLALRRVTRITRAIENKHVQVGVSETTPAADNPTIVNLTAIAQGDDTGNRAGNKVTLKGVYVNMFMRANATPTLVGQFVRCIIVQDRQQNADTLPTLANVMFSTDINSFLNDDNFGRFRILYDRVFPLGDPASGLGPPNRYVKIRLPFKKGLQVRYNGAASTDIQKNGLSMMIWSDVTDASGDEPTVSQVTRTYFQDL